jgi:hypothetical protein
MAAAIGCCQLLQFSSPASSGDMPEPEINIRTDAPADSAGRAKKAKRSATPWIILGSAALCALAAIVIFATAANTPSSGTSNKTAAPTGPPASNPSSSAPSVSETAAPDSGEVVIDDPKGELLWASPTAGESIDLAFVPAGTQCLIHVRPAKLFESPEGQRAMASLGPWGESAVAQLREALGAELSDVESLLISVVVDGAGKLDAGLRAELGAKWTDDDLAARFPDGSRATLGHQTYLVVGDRAYFLPKPAVGKSQWLVVCPAELATELIKTAGESPALVRDIERLAEHTDAARTLTMIVAPQFLQASGNELLMAEAAPLHKALEWLHSREATAVLVSAHWDENFFIEVRATPTLNVPARRLAAKLRERIAAAADAIEEIVLSRQWPEYGRKVLTRFPAMMRALARYSRAGEDDRQAVVRAYLPRMAGHNLVMASELLLTQSNVNEAAAAPAPGSAATPQTLEERLAKKTSLTFSKETLERAIELLAEDAGVEIAIQGADLQLEGITKNQSLAIDLRDRPLEEILVEVLLRANPDRTAAGPADPKLKLVYTVEPGRGDSPGRIIVTTRAAAERRGDRLPKAFLVRGR